MFALMLLCSAATATTASPALQDDESDPDRILTYEHSTLYMYGNDDDGGTHDTWDTWNHAESTDGQSSDDFFENNNPGSEGGGRREFTFDGSDPSNETINIDSELPITGKVVLQIFCDSPAGECQDDIELTLRLGPENGATDLTTLALDGPDEDGGNVYTFEFLGHNIKEIEPDEVLGIRIAFTKPSDFFNGGYRLDLGRDNFELNIPVLPPYEEEVPGLDLQEGEEYVSPYSEGSAGFVEMEAESSSWGGPIFFLIFSVGIAALVIKFLPDIGIWKVLTVVTITFGLLASLCIIPLISGPVALSSAIDENAPGVWTIDELAGLQEREGTFLGELVPGDEFKVWIEYDTVYRAKDVEGHGDWHYGLGFEPYADSLGDPTDTTPRGREYVQLYFSLLDIDPTAGSAVIINVKMINITGPEGEGRVVPQWAVPGEEENQFWVKSPEFGGRWVIPEKMADGSTVLEIVGVSYSWQYYPMLLVLVGIGMAGVGIWQLNKGRSPASREYDYDDDFDLDDDDDFEDDDLDFDL